MHQVNRDNASALSTGSTENQLRGSVGCSRLTISAEEICMGSVCDMVNSEGVGGEKYVAGFAASSCRQLSLSSNA